MVRGAATTAVEVGVAAQQTPMQARSGGTVAGTAVEGADLLSCRYPIADQHWRVPARRSFAVCRG